MEATPEARVTDFPASDLYMFSQLSPRVSNPCLSSAALTGLNVLPTRACFLRGEVGRNAPAGYTTIKVLNSSTHPGSGRSEENGKPGVLASRATGVTLATGCSHLGPRELSSALSVVTMEAPTMIQRLNEESHSLNHNQ